MGSFMQITAILLCSQSWICEFLTVEVHPGEDITLFCSNLSSSPTQTDWFRVIHGTKPSCISSMYGSESEPSYCHGFQSEKFNMSSNKTTVFLQIKQVDLMDSGLYFCGFYIKKHTIVGSATELIIKANEDSKDEEEDSDNKKAADQLTDLMPGILGALTVVLSVAVVVLAVKNRRLERDSGLF
ncbi:T-cell surface glycoprotein CD8 beta chain-like [Poecilia reticulata]|uniref:T-cell surface glycoprotein CD8 beta chain-like n=1 Tax=Poecilia reticulata TaxID=8081 RepID=UPI0007EB6C19|nr:PREDICTED: T-cell surface glycoprotein CD8 beta chain-like [Poecilia reticulata]